MVGESGKNNDHFFCGGKRPHEPIIIPSFPLFFLQTSSRLTPTPWPECGSSLYTALDILPEVYCVKSGGLDDAEIRGSLEVGIEFYTKDRVGFATELQGAQQEKAFGDIGK